MLARLCPDGVLVSLDDRIVYASPAADAILGPGAAGGLLGHPTLALAPPVQRNCLRERMRRAAAGRFGPLDELAMCRADGRRLDAELTAAR
ncbi:MAG: PAS domain-containing protein [Massilia sp.]